MIRSIKCSIFYVEKFDENDEKKKCELWYSTINSCTQNFQRHFYGVSFYLMISNSYFIPFCGLVTAVRNTLIVLLQQRKQKLFFVFVSLWVKARPCIPISLIKKIVPNKINLSRIVYPLVNLYKGVSFKIYLTIKGFGLLNIHLLIS